jgi:hypothetical protein
MRMASIEHHRTLRRHAFFYILAAAAIALMTGCKSPRSPEVRGRVLDATTRTPIQDANVFFYDHPSTRTTTDVQGGFRLKETHNFYLLRLPPGDGTWPRGTYFDKVVVAHTNYIPFEFYGLDHVDEVLLKPRP